MKIFIAVIAAVTILGGFVGGELIGRPFSITGAAIGGLGLAALLLGLGAHFDSQEKKQGREKLPSDIRALFDRMLANASREKDGHHLASGSLGKNISLTKVVHPELQQFVQAMKRLGAIQTDTQLLSIGKPLVHKFDSPYIAAMDAYVTMLGGAARPGIAGASSIGTGIALGSNGICEFVLEGKVSHEVGKKYFDQVMEFMRFGLPADVRVTSRSMEFESMLALARERKIADTVSALPLAFKDGKAAIEYACKYMKCPLQEGSFLPALVLDLRQLSRDESAVIVQRDGHQVAMLRVASDDGGFPVLATTAGVKGPKLQPGELVAWEAAKYLPDVAASMGANDQRSGWVGLIVGTLKAEYRDGEWVGDERFTA